MPEDSTFTQPCFFFGNYFEENLRILEKYEVMTAIGRGGPYGCEKSRFPHFLDNWITDGGEVVSLTFRPPFTLRQISGPHLC
jgi:hypothetical protein